MNVLSEKELYSLNEFEKKYNTTAQRFSEADSFFSFLLILTRRRTLQKGDRLIL